MSKRQRTFDSKPVARPAPSREREKERASEESSSTSPSPAPAEPTSEPIAPPAAWGDAIPIQGKDANAGPVMPKLNVPSPGSGSPLPTETAEQMGQSFDTDFSSVRIHQDKQADAIGAKAYTRGENIHFSPGAYNTESQAGKKLLGHELAHVVQQRQGKVSSPGGDAPVNLDQSLEHDADVKGERAARGADAVRGEGVEGSGEVAGVADAGGPVQGVLPWLQTVIRNGKRLARYMKESPKMVNQFEAAYEALFEDIAKSSKKFNIVKLKDENAIAAAFEVYQKNGYKALEEHMLMSIKISTAMSMGSPEYTKRLFQGGGGSETAHTNIGSSEIHGQEHTPEISKQKRSQLLLETIQEMYGLSGKKTPEGLSEQEGNDESADLAQTHKKKGETAATKMGKAAHNELLSEEKNRPFYEAAGSTDSAFKKYGTEGTITGIPRKHDLKTLEPKEQKGTVTPRPDFIRADLKILGDIKPSSRNLTKDKQQMISHIMGFFKAYGFWPEIYRYELYDPKTSKPEKTVDMKIDEIIPKEKRNEIEARLEKGTTND